MGKETWARQLGTEKVTEPAKYDTRKRPGSETPRYSFKGGFYEPNPKFAPPYRDLGTTLAPTPKYSLRSRYDEPPPDQTPGPEYVTKPFDKYLSRSYGTLQRKEALDESPRQKTYVAYSKNPHGPAEFDARHIPSKPRAPAYKIGINGGTSWLTTNDNPAGADYSIKTTISAPASPRYTIGSIHVLKKDNFVPGPGKYSPTDYFGKDFRPIHPTVAPLKPFNTPGPGKYDIQEPPGLRTRKSMVAPVYDSHVWDPTATDAPYHKYPREFETTNQKTFHGPVKELTPFNTPGPGSYQISPGWIKSTYRSMSPPAKHRTEPSWCLNDRSPGPANYKVDDRITRPAAPKRSFGDYLGESWIPKSQAPAPDEYRPDTSPTKKKAPRFTIRPFYPYFEPEDQTKDAHLYLLPDERGLSATIHPKDPIPLIPK